MAIKKNNINENQTGEMIMRLNDIYDNKSGDEYKMSGDISKSPVYDKLQRMTADLSIIKGLNKVEIDELKKMFNMMHRPLFKKTVTQYIQHRSPEVSMITAYFTIGYRVLIAELARIYTSTEATEKGFVYKPRSFNRRLDMRKFIRAFNNNTDAELTRKVRESTKSVLQNEYAFTESIFIGSAAAVAKALGTVADAIGPTLREISAWIGLLFGSVSELNPVSLVSSLLSKHYDNMVDKYDNAAALYFATKDAYDEYMKIPEAQRSAKVESKYLKNIETYNIKMQNLHAKIEHYDQRALKEAQQSEKKATDTSSSKTSEPDSSSSSSDDDSSSGSDSSSGGGDDWDF